MGFMDRMRHFSRLATKAWREVMTREDEEDEGEEEEDDDQEEQGSQQHRRRRRRRRGRSRLMVNPQHHLRSPSVGSLNTTGSSLGNLSDVLLLGDEETNNTGGGEEEEWDESHPLHHPRTSDPETGFWLGGRRGDGGSPSHGGLSEPLLDSTATANTASNPPVLLHHAPAPPSPTRLRARTHSASSTALLSPATRQRVRSWIRKAGNYLAYATLLCMLCLVPTVVYHQGFQHRHLDSAAFRSAGVMAAGTVILSLRLVYLHLTHWYMPSVQKYVVRILWMVPLYAVQSWLSLGIHEMRLYIDTLRDYYEAFVIASFVYYLIELLGGQDALCQILKAKAMVQPDDSSQPRRPLLSNTIHTSEPVEDGLDDDEEEEDEEEEEENPDSHLGRHSFPLSLILDEWEMGEEFMLNCKHGVLQYVVFKSISAFITFICESAGVYGEGKFSWFNAYPYLCFFQNVSVMYALYCLVLLFSAVSDELRYPINWRPLGKFLCIKGVVFFTWWQGVVIFYLKDHGWIKEMGTWSSEQVANGLIDYCVVIEMVGFAIAHSYTFTYKEYLPSAIPLEFRRTNTNTACNTTTTHNTETRNSPAVTYSNVAMTPSGQPQPGSSLKYAVAHVMQDEEGDENQQLFASATVLGVLTTPSTISLETSKSQDHGGGGATSDGSGTSTDRANTRSPNETATNSNNNQQHENDHEQQDGQDSPWLHSPSLSPQSRRIVTSTYHPPATLDRPMDFRDAFWSSTVPKETLQDIQAQLQQGGALRPRVFSLPKVRVRTRTRSHDNSSQGTDNIVGSTSTTDATTTTTTTTEGAIATPHSSTSTLAEQEESGDDLEDEQQQQREEEAKNDVIVPQTEEEQEDESTTTKCNPSSVDATLEEQKMEATQDGDNNTNVVTEEEAESGLHPASSSSSSSPQDGASPAMDPTIENKDNDNENESAE